VGSDSAIQGSQALFFRQSTHRLPFVSGSGLTYHIALAPEADGFREKLAHEIVSSGLHRGLETEKIFDLLITKAGERSDPATFAEALDERDRRVLFEIFFESFSEHSWEEAESCLGVLRSRRVEQELAELQKKLESKPPTEELRRIITRRLELQKLLAGQ